MTDFLRRKIDTRALSEFFMGDLYPLVIALITLVGSVTGTEFYLGMVHILLVSVSLIVCPSLKPMVISLLTFVMQLSLEHSPFYPNYSSYYYTGWRLIAVIVMGVAVVFSIAYFVIKDRTYKRVSFKNTPFLLPIIALSVAFSLNGVFSGSWVLGDLVFGLANAFVYSLVFILIYHGFAEKEDSSELSRYFSYISMLIALVIISELAVLFITNENIFVGGTINKTEVALGWGIWTVVGASLSVLIPAMFYGIEFNKYPWLYFAVATLTLVFCALTMSRNALLFGGLAYVTCVIICCFFGKYKRVFRIIAGAGVLAAAVTAVVFWDKIYALFGENFSLGLALNGREHLWPAAIDNFLDSPIFGKGFYGLDVTTDFSYGGLPLQAHNTILQLMSATGAVGLVCYLCYRFYTLKPVFKRPSLRKTFMALSVVTLLLGSMLDNFVFFIYPTFHYTVALAVIHKAAREEEAL